MSILLLIGQRHCFADVFDISSCSCHLFTCLNKFHTFFHLYFDVIIPQNKLASCKARGNAMIFSFHLVININAAWIAVNGNTFIIEVCYPYMLQKRSLEGGRSGAYTASSFKWALTKKSYDNFLNLSKNKGISTYYLKGHFVTLYWPIFLNCPISRWAVGSFDLTSPKLKIHACFSSKPATVLVKCNDCSHQSWFQSKQASVPSGKALINLLYTFCLAPNSRMTKLGTR